MPNRGCAQALLKSAAEIVMEKINVQNLVIRRSVFIGDWMPKGRRRTIGLFIGCLL
jgi:hypothetical protein